MACKLTRDANGVFHAQTGSRIQINTTSSLPARVVRILYAGQQDGEAPLEITVEQGQHKLLVAAVGVEEDQLIRIVEVDGGNTCPLRNLT